MFFTVQAGSIGWGQLYEDWQRWSSGSCPWVTTTPSSAKAGGRVAGKLSGGKGPESADWQQLNMSVQVAKRSSGILASISSSAASRTTLGILALCSALARPHLKSCVWCWAPHSRTDIEGLETLQRRAREESETRVLWGVAEGPGAV